MAPTPAVLDSKNVRVAVTGAWFVGDLGATAPTSATDPLAAFRGLGYLSEDGTSRTLDRSTNDIKAWQNSAKVRTVVTDAGISYTFTLIETTRETVALYNGLKTTDIGADGTYTVNPSRTGGRRSFVFIIFDGDYNRLVYIPEGEVTEIGDQTSASGDAIGFEVTIQGYASATLSGDTEKVFDPSLAVPVKGASAPGSVFPTEATVTASDSTNAGKLAALGYVANPTTAWTTGQKITIGGFAFSWTGTAWAAGARP
ncbi:hypothetical protein [Plantibacter sp. YIM 135249]|uniref:phage tail tube protein n=1 Tax=Plantibacter sp. YIM 135249 TaxID=3423918 RepID=UPI003D33B291